MTLDEMKTTIIRTFGFEHPAALYFFECCEMDDSDQILNEIAFELAMEWREDGE